MKLCEVGRAEYNGETPKSEPVSIDMFLTL
jgi:hypothetical protein